MKKRGKGKKVLLIAISCVLALLIAGDWALSVIVYRSNIDQRFESYEPLMLRVEDYAGLERTQYRFPSDKGQMLTGYLYAWGTDQRGIVIIAHGFGAGHNNYMDCADYFARRGYYVFAYDATGNDESEGDGVGGMPQGQADLDRAISFVENSKDIPDLPIVLFGHSWGAYSVCSVLSWHPEVKAVIACSGCNRSSDLFEVGGRQQAGWFIDLMMPFVKLHERICFGRYASNTALDGFAASSAAVMIVHSADDDVVPIETGYDLYYEKYRDDPRFTFIRFEEKGHNNLLHDTSYLDAFNLQYAVWVLSLDYDPMADENRDRFKEEKSAFIHTRLDREKWSHMLDTELMDRFAAFYDQHITD